MEALLFLGRDSLYAQRIFHLTRGMFFAKVAVGTKGDRLSF